MRRRAHFFICEMNAMRKQKNIWVVLFAATLTLPLLTFYHYPPNGSVFADALSLGLWALVAVALVMAGLNQSLKGVRLKSESLFELGQLRLRTVRLYDYLSSPNSVYLILGVSIFCWAIQVRQGQYGFLSVVLTTCGAAVSAWAAFVMGTRWAQHRKTDDCAANFALALLWMGVVVSCVGWVQYFSADGYWPWINPLATPGRIYGNLRQPNHLALVIAWAVWGIVWYSTRKGVPSSSGILALMFVVPVLAMTGSRMGQALLGGFVVLSWVSPHRGLRLKFTLIAVASYIITWLLLGPIAQNGGPAFFGLRGALGSSTGSRFELWSQVIHMLGQLPWYGCGIGQFNFCWTHSVLEERVHGAVFHAHNLILHGLVEWGWPLTLLLMLWLTVGLALFVRYGLKSAAALPAGILLSSLLYAMLEYPWWYSYLLLPTSFAAGWMWSLSYKEYLNAENAKLNLSQVVLSETSLFGNKLRAGLPGVFLLCFGIVYVMQYLPLRFLFAAGYVKPMEVEELHKINSQAALFSMPLSYAIVMKLTENVIAEDAASMIPYLKLAGRGANDPEFLSRFAVVSALAQQHAMAQHLAWRAMQSDPGQREKLRRTVEKMNSPALGIFAAYLDNPTMVNLDRSVFYR